jgi:hypothetical protein
MRLRNHFESVLREVISSENLAEVIALHKPHLTGTAKSVQVAAIMEQLLQQQISLDEDLLRFLNDDELFELGFQFGFEGNYSRWRMIEDLNAWFEDSFDLFSYDSPLKLPSVHSSHAELLDWLGELTFNELQKICELIQTQFGGDKYFYRLTNNGSIDQIMSKFKLVAPELLFKVIIYYYQNTSFEEAEQIELGIEDPQEVHELEKAYQTLQVSEKQSNLEIKKSFHRMARDFHPDLNGEDNKSKTLNFLAVKQAFETIKNSRPGPW